MNLLIKNIYKNIHVLYRYICRQIITMNISINLKYIFLFKQIYHLRGCIKDGCTFCGVCIVDVWLKFIELPWSHG